MNTKERTNAHGVSPDDRTDVLLDDLRAETARLADAIEDLNERLDARPVNQEVSE